MPNNMFAKRENNPLLKLKGPIAQFGSFTPRLGTKVLNNENSVVTRPALSFGYSAKHVSVRLSPRERCFVAASKMLHVESPYTRPIAATSKADYWREKHGDGAAGWP